MSREQAREREQQQVRIDGQGLVAVSDKVYEAIRYFTKKEEYFTKDLKKEQFICDQKKRIARFLPSREDSLERLWESGAEFAEDQMPVEDRVMMGLMMETLLEQSSDLEKQILALLFYQGKTVEEASKNLHMSETTFRRKRDALFHRYGEILENIGWHIA